jgi:uncharacterized membrane protein (DUF485 family)
MSDELAGANVNRAYSLAATCIPIFTFMLFFLYPRFARGEIDGSLFQATLVVMGIATFSFVLASLHYYASSMGGRLSATERGHCARRGDRLWLVGSTQLFLAPSLVLLTVGLLTVALAWFVLWLIYLLVARHYFPRVQTALERNG